MTHPDHNFFSWIEEHINDNPDRLRLKYHNSDSSAFDYGSAITQIECRRKFAGKLRSTLAEAPHFYFPSVLAGEQSTGDALAAYHATLIPEGCELVDLTSGLGIDVAHCARVASEVVAIEMKPDYAEALAYNLSQLGVRNVEVVCGDCRTVMQDMPDSDTRVMFVDPARRDSSGGRTYALTDCSPDVAAMLPVLASKGRTLIIKASPMLDITQSCRELRSMRRVVVLGTATECKELVLIVDLKSGHESDLDSIPVEAVTVTPTATSVVDFTAGSEREAVADYRMPRVGDYWYEPYPAVMKAGAMRTLCARYGVSKPSANTNVFFSDSLVEAFPGNRYRIERIEPYASRVIKRLRRDYPKADIAVRNFVCDAAMLRRKLGIVDGGDCRIVGISDLMAEPWLVIVRPVAES